MNNLRELRKKNSLQQTELAQKLGVAQSTLSGWENGKFEIDNQSLIKIAKMFHVSIDYILGLDFQNEKADSPEGKSAPKSDSDDMLQKINASLPKLDRDSLLRVLGYVESLSNQHDSKKK